MTDPTRLGKYEIQSVLGKGAMGVVYKAIDPSIERTVAIKTVRKDLIDPDLAGEFMARFKNEARAAGRLQHPNIVGIYEFGEEDNLAYIAMEYVDGTGLREYLDRKARFELSQLVAIMTQLLQALDFAHERGVVHRDIKPSNLIMTRNGVLKLADFGIARIDASSLTMTGMVVGTPSFMSPEQCQGRPCDHRSDLFSAGVVFYELLTGENPFTGPAVTIAYKICHEDPPPPSEMSPLALPRAIDAVVAKALARSMEDRFQSARAFQLALRSAAAEGALERDASATTLYDVADVQPQPAARATWDDTVLTAVEKRLARVVGPIAKVLVRKVAAQAHDVAELHSLLATNIDDRDERQRFLTESHAANAGDPNVRAGARPSAAVTGQPPGPSHAPGSRADARLRPLEQSFVDQTTTRLAVYLGPIAKVVARRAAQRARTSEEFVQIVAGHVGTQDRRAFLREMGFED